MSINPKKKAVKIGAIAIGAVIGLTTIASLIIPNSLSQNPLLASSLSEYYAINQNDVNIIKQLIANDDSITNEKKQELNENINNILTGRINNQTAPLSIYNKKELSNNLHFQYKVNYDSQIKATVNILPIFNTLTVKALIRSIYEEKEYPMVNDIDLSNIDNFRTSLINDLKKITSTDNTNLINILKQDTNNLYIRELRLQVLRNDIWQGDLNFEENLIDQLSPDIETTFNSFTFSIPFLEIKQIKLVNENIPSELTIGSDNKHHTNEFLNIDTNLILTYDSKSHSFVYTKNGNAVFYVSLTEESLKTLQGTFRYDIKNYLKSPNNLNISVPDKDKSKWKRVSEGHEDENENVYKPNKVADNNIISKDYEKIVYENQLNNKNNQSAKPQWIMFRLKRINMANTIDGYYLLTLNDFNQLIESEFFKNLQFSDERNEEDMFKKLKFHQLFIDNIKNHKIPKQNLFVLSESGMNKATNFSNYSYFEFFENNKLNYHKAYVGDFIERNGVNDTINPLGYVDNWTSLNHPLMRKYSSIKNNNGNNWLRGYFDNIISLSEDTLKSLQEEDFQSGNFNNFHNIVKQQTSEISKNDGDLIDNNKSIFNNKNTFKKFISSNWIFHNITNDKKDWNDDNISTYIKQKLFKNSGSFYDAKSTNDKELQNFQALPFIENKTTYKQYYQLKQGNPLLGFINDNNTLLRILGNIINANDIRYELDKQTISLYKTYEKNQNQQILKELQEHLKDIINQKLVNFNPLGNILIKNNIHQYVHQVLINQKVLPDDFLAIKDSLDIDRENIDLKLKNITYENWNVVPKNIKNWFKFLAVTIRNVLITNIATVGADSNYNRVEYNHDDSGNMFDYHNLNGGISNLITTSGHSKPKDIIETINSVSDYPFRLIYDFQLNLNENFYKYKKGNWSNFNTYKFIVGQNVKNKQFINNLLINSLIGLTDVDTNLFEETLTDDILWDTYTENNTFNNNKIHFMAPYIYYNGDENKVLAYLPLWKNNDKNELYFYDNFYNYYHNSSGNRADKLETRYDGYLSSAESYRELFKLDNTDYINKYIIKGDRNLDQVFLDTINNNTLYQQMLRNLRLRSGGETDEYIDFKNTLNNIVNFLKNNRNINLTDLFYESNNALRVLNDLSINGVLPEKRELFDNLNDKVKDKGDYDTTVKWLTSNKDQDNIVKIAKDNNNYKLKANKNGDNLYPHFNYAKNWKYETIYDNIINNLDLEKMKKSGGDDYVTVPNGLINDYLSFVNSLRYKTYDNDDNINIKNINYKELVYDEITRQQIKIWLKKFLNNNKDITDKDHLINNLINEIKKKFGIKYTGTRKEWTGKYTETANGEMPERFNKTIYENVTETYEDYNDRESYWTGNYNYGSTRSFTIKHEIGGEYNQARANNFADEYRYRNESHWANEIKSEILNNIRNNGDDPSYYQNSNGNLIDINGINDTGNISVEKRRIGRGTYEYKIYKTYHINYRVKSKVYSTRPKRKTRTVKKAKTITATRYKVYDYEHDYETFDRNDLYSVDKEETVILSGYKNLPYSYYGFKTENYYDENDLETKEFTEPIYRIEEYESDEWENYRVRKTHSTIIKATENAVFYTNWGEFKRSHANYRENYEIEQLKNYIRSQPELYKIVKQNGNEDFSLLEGFNNFKGSDYNNDWELHSTGNGNNNAGGRRQYIYRKYEFSYYVTERRRVKKTRKVQDGTRTYTKQVPKLKSREIYGKIEGNTYNRINVLTLLWYFENHYFFDDFKLNDKLDINKPLETTDLVSKLEEQPINEEIIKQKYNIKNILFESQYNPYIFFKTKSGVKIVKRTPLQDTVYHNKNNLLYSSAEAEITAINRRNNENKLNIYTNQNDNIYKDDKDLQNLLKEEIAKQLSPNKSQLENLTILQNILLKNGRISKANGNNRIESFEGDIAEKINEIVTLKNLIPYFNHNKLINNENRVDNAIKYFDGENIVENYLIDNHNEVYINILKNGQNGLYRINSQFVPYNKTLYETFIPSNIMVNIWKDKSEDDINSGKYFELTPNGQVKAIDHLRKYFNDDENYQDSVVEFDSYIKTLLHADMSVFNDILQSRENIRDLRDNVLYDDNNNNRNIFNIIRYRGAFFKNYKLTATNYKTRWDKDFFKIYTVNDAFIKLVVQPAIKYVNFIEEKFNQRYDEPTKKLFIVNTMINMIKIVFGQSNYEGTIINHIPNLPKKWNTFFNGDTWNYDDTLNPYLKYIKLWNTKENTAINNNNNVEYLKLQTIKQLLVDYYNKDINNDALNDYLFNINSKELSFNKALLELSQDNKNILSFDDYGFIYINDENKYINEININGTNYGYYTDYKTMWNAHASEDNQAGKDDIVIMISDNITSNETLKLQGDYNFEWYGIERNTVLEDMKTTKFYDQLFGDLLPHHKTLLKIPLDKLINYQRMAQFVYKSDKYGDLLISIDIDGDWSIYIGDTKYHTAANIALDDIKTLENYFAFKNNQTEDIKDLSDYQINIEINKHNDNQGLNNQLIASINLKNDKKFNNLHTNKWFNEKGERTNIANRQTLDYYEKIWKTKSDAKPIRFENITPINKQDIDNFFNINYHSDNSLRNDYNLGSFINNVGLYNLINNKMFDMLNLIFDIDKIKQYQRLAFKDFDSDFDFDKTNQLIDDYINLLQPFNDMVAILTKRNLMMFKTIIPAFKEMINQQGEFKDFNELLTLNSRFAISDVIKKVITDITYTMNSINQIETTFNERYNLSKYKELNLISNYDNIVFEFNVINHFNSQAELNDNLRNTTLYNFQFTPLQELKNYLDYQNNQILIKDITTLSEAKQHHIRQLVAFFNQQMLNNEKIRRMFNDEQYRSRIINIMNMFFNTLYYEITNHLLHTFILNDDKLAVLNNLNESLKKVKNYEYQYHDNHKPSGYGSFIITRKSTWNQLQPYMNGQDDQELDDEHQNKGDITEQDYYIKNNTGSRIHPNPKSPYYIDKDTNNIKPIITNNFDISNKEEKMIKNVESDFVYNKIPKPIVEKPNLDKVLKKIQFIISEILQINIDYLMLNVFLSDKTSNDINTTIPNLLKHAIYTYFRIKHDRNKIKNEELENITNGLNDVYEQLIAYIVRPYNVFTTHKDKSNIPRNDNSNITFNSKGEYWNLLTSFLNELRAVINDNNFNIEKENAYALTFDMTINYLKQNANIINPAIYPRLKTINDNNIDDEQIDKILNIIDKLNDNMNITNNLVLTANEYYFNDELLVIANANNVYRTRVNSQLNAKTLKTYLEQVKKLNTFVGNNYVNILFKVNQNELTLNELEKQIEYNSRFTTIIAALFRQNFIVWLTTNKALLKQQQQEKYIANYNQFVNENKAEFNKWWIIDDYNNNKTVIPIEITNNENETFTFYDWRNFKYIPPENNNPDEPVDYLPPDTGEARPILLPIKLPEN